MTKNLYIHATDSKSHAAGRGSPQISKGTRSAQFGPEDFAVLTDAASAATITLHQAWAENWGCWNQFYRDACELAQPFYMFPLEMAQQYFSFICGMQQCIGEPVGQQRYGEKKPGPRLAYDREAEREEFEQAMDVAIGATPEVWVEVVQVGRAAAA